MILCSIVHFLDTGIMNFIKIISGILEGLKEIYRKEGTLGFYRGKLVYL